MNKHLVRDRIESIGIIPSIRTSSAADALFAADAISAAGIVVVEITTTVSGAVDVIAELVHTMPDLTVGADVSDLEMARRCVGAGASFVTSPGFDRRIVDFAAREEVLVMPGALTPTEVSIAREAGADLVKVFPCAPLGGARYIRALKAPLADVPLVASGGVNEQTVAEFIRAGAVAVGVGAALVPKKAIQQRQPDWIIELARRFLSLVHEARERKLVP
jgi:2-dehydro-3-deoxyphosphogluconate aldolase/(4S)-4-hydroxy-2-oxoglutarate aldolase